MMSPLPSISQVYSMLIQEDKQREIRSSSQFLAESTSLSVEVRKPQQFYKNRMDRTDMITEPRKGERSEERKSSLYYNYCKKPGHSIKRCYRLHGFPPNYKFKGGEKNYNFC